VVYLRCLLYYYCYYHYYYYDYYYSGVVVDYSLETLALRWIQPRESAVQFDPGGEDDSQFIINDFVLKNCSYNSTDGLAILY